MTTTYTLNISSHDDGMESNANVTTEHPEVLQRLLQLAGVDKSEESPGYVSAPNSGPIAYLDDQEDVCDVCHQSPCVCNEVPVDETADYDYDNQEVDSEGHPLDQNEYIWKGPREPNRIVGPNSGTNPLAETILDRMKKQWASILAEADLTAGVAGTMSPLSDPTKPEFDKDPMAKDEPVTDGSRSPFSTVRRQKVEK